MIRALQSVVVVVLSVASVVASTAQSDPSMLEHTSWVGHLVNKEPFVLEVQDRGRLRYIDANGTVTTGRWRGNETQIELEIEGKRLKLTGTVARDHIKGTVSGKEHPRSEWSATKQPIAVRQSIPRYTPLAAVAQIEGSVVLDLTVSASGKVTVVNAINGHPSLREPSVEAAKDWRFRPIAGDAPRAARLIFSFLILEREKDEQVISPVFHSPYRIEVRRGIPSLSNQLRQSVPVKQHFE